MSEPAHMTGMHFESDVIVNGVLVKAGTVIKFAVPEAHPSAIEPTEAEKLLGRIAVEVMQEDMKFVKHWACLAKVEFPDGAPIVRIAAPAAQSEVSGPNICPRRNTCGPHNCCYPSCRYEPAPQTQPMEAVPTDMVLVHKNDLRLAAIGRYRDEAVLAEREACAALAEEGECDQTEYSCATVTRIAKAIRARSNDMNGVRPEGKDGN